MIHELIGIRRAQAAHVFAGMDDTAILSCLQNYPGTHVWADDPEYPTCAHALIGGAGEGTGGFSFVAGDANSPSARELIAMWPAENKGDCIMVPQNEEWAELVEEIFPSGKRQIRYSTSKTEHHFDVDVLASMRSDPAPELHIVPVCGELYTRLYAGEWSRDQVANFPDSQTYERLAAGFACLHDGEIVGAASCYSSYDRGFEIEIDTREDFRRRGIARACVAHLILYALENDLYPSWDAANLMSLGLAQSLGYVPSGEYRAYLLDAGCRNNNSRS